MVRDANNAQSYLFDVFKGLKTISGVHSSEFLATSEVSRPEAAKFKYADNEYRWLVLARLICAKFDKRSAGSPDTPVPILEIAMPRVFLCCYIVSKVSFIYKHV